MNAVRKIDHHKELISNVRVALALALFARIPSREVKKFKYHSISAVVVCSLRFVDLWAYRSALSINVVV